MRDYNLFSLRGMLERGSEETVGELLKGFQCPRDHDRVVFLHDKIITFEKKNMTCIYLVMTDESIAGYFSISIKCLQVLEDWSISRSLDKRINIDRARTWLRHTSSVNW